MTYDKQYQCIPNYYLDFLTSTSVPKVLSVYHGCGMGIDIKDASSVQKFLNGSIATAEENAFFMTDSWRVSASYALGDMMEGDDGYIMHCDINVDGFLTLDMQGKRFSLKEQEDLHKSIRNEYSGVVFLNYRDGGDLKDASTIISTWEPERVSFTYLEQIPELDVVMQEVEDIFQVSTEDYLQAISSRGEKRAVLR